MKKVEYYEAFDGTKFNNHEECKDYEEAHKSVKTAFEAANFLRTFCSNFSACGECPFFIDHWCAIGEPCDNWDDIENI